MSGISKKEIERLNNLKMGEERTEFSLDQTTGQWRSKRIPTDRPRRGVRFTHRWNGGGVSKPEKS